MATMIFGSFISLNISAVATFIEILASIDLANMHSAKVNTRARMSPVNIASAYIQHQQLA